MLDPHLQNHCARPGKGRACSTPTRDIQLSSMSQSDHSRLSYSWFAMKQIVSLALVSCIPLAAQSPLPAALPGLKLSLDELKAQYTHFGVVTLLNLKIWP